MIKVMDYKEWKKRFMGKSNPVTGNVIGIRFPDMRHNDIPKLTDKLKGLNSKYIEYAIHYHSMDFVEHKKHKAIVFDDISEYEKATAIHKGFLNGEAPNYFISIWVGGYELFVQIVVNNETRPILSKLQSNSDVTKDYDGIVLGG